ncbi:MAG: hypothetical protein QOE08_1390 [Thermoleophilaceae bacterium]|nr:hypothetical protein [Thermoleophilaceae bacterium]
MRRAAALALLAVALGGCGVGPGAKTPGGVELRVTRDFGHRQLADAKRDGIRDGDTVMRFLQAERKVTTRFGGGYVQSIDGLNGSKSGEHDWFYYVNGSEADKSAADYGLSRGDVVTWDYHRWSATQHIPAIVGAYPAPFTSNFAGKRRPGRVECADQTGAICRAAKKKLSTVGVNAGASLGPTASSKVIRVVVGTWPEVRQVKAAEAIEHGPQASGVFARFDSSGRRLELLDGDGRAARLAPPGTGLVAATAQGGRELVWIVTGNDEAGVRRAIEALNEKALRGAFAIATGPAGVQTLPLAAAL